MNKIIEVKNLSHKITRLDGSSFWGLKGVNHTFFRGQITAIIGPSGAGKTLFCKHLNGLLKPTLGSLKAFEIEITSQTKKIKNIFRLRRQIGYVCQNPEKQLFEENVEREVVFGPLNFGFNRDVALNQAKKYFHSLGWNIRDLKQSPFRFSGGQKRKIALASILSYEPEVIIFDSPTSGLDIFSQEKFRSLIHDLKTKFNKTIIFVSHNMNEVLALADQVILLQNGEKILQTTPLHLFTNQKLCNQYQLNLPETISFMNKLKESGFNTQELNPTSLDTFAETLVARILKSGGKLSRDE